MAKLTAEEWFDPRRSLILLLEITRKIGCKVDKAFGNLQGGTGRVKIKSKCIAS